MDQPQRIVVVGAGLAGQRVAQRLRRLGYAGRLALVGAEQHRPYDRPPLSKQRLAGTDAESSTPPYLLDADAFAALELFHLAGRTATGLDPVARQVRLDDGATLDYDVAVVATGARPRRLPTLPAARVLRSWEDLLALRAELSAADHVTIVGAGVLGLEVAAAARARGVEVTVAEPAAEPMARVVGPEVGAAIAALHRDHGVELRTGLGVVGAEATADGRWRVEYADGSQRTTDLVVAAVGSVAETDWLEGSGLAVDDGVLVDATGTTSDAAVLAAGDVARVATPDGRRGPRLEHWTSAGDTANLVATNALLPPEERTPTSELPYFWSDQYDLKLQGLGLAAPGDELHVVDGSLAERGALAVYVRDGRAVAVVGLDRPAALNRCRPHLVRGSSLDELIAAAPWERRTPARPAR